MCGPTHDWHSWTFDLDPGGVEPVLGIPLAAGVAVDLSTEWRQFHRGGARDLYPQRWRDEI